MNKMDEFKEFVKQKPILIKYVKNNEATWQQFYEMYALYGEVEEVWDPYLKEKDISLNDEIKTSYSLNDIINMAKRLDVNKIQNGISSIQKALGLVSDLFLKEKENILNDTYEPRPLYKHFED